MDALHLTGPVLVGPDETADQAWVSGGRLTFSRPAGASTTRLAGWVLPGMVDAHCHVGIGPAGPVALDEALEQARTERGVGALLLRDAGSPVDTRAFDDDPELPRIIRAGRHLARPKRYIPGLGIELAEESELPAAVAQQARAGDGWVKLVGDWIDRATGDLAPLWGDDVLVEAIAAAHAEGARVTAHVFGEDALPGLVRAGIDCLEHGTGLTEDTIDLVVEHGTALVPTLINIENFPGIADGAARYPGYAAHMRDLHARVGDTVAAALEAGVEVYAGTDAGGGIRHGRIADEVAALVRVGMDPHDALGAACWDARGWLGAELLAEGAPADVVAYPEDPRAVLGADPAAGAALLRTPSLVVLRGRVAG